MLFVYPAVVSDKVDKKYLPGLLKTMELYFLHEIVSDIADKEVELKVSRGRVSGKYSEIRMESKYLPEDIGLDLDFFTEQESLKDMKKRWKREEALETTTSTEIKKQLESEKENLRKAESQLRNLLDDLKKAKTELGQAKGGKSAKDEDEIQSRIENLEKQIDYKQEVIQSIRRKISELEKQRYIVKSKKEEEEREKPKTGAVAGAESLKIDTTMAFDLRPTAAVVTASVIVKTPKRFSMKPAPPPTAEKRDIPISVKVIPIIASNFNDIYYSMTKDYFSNKVSAMFKSVGRKLSKAAVRYLAPISKKLLRVTKSKENVDIFKDIILSKQGIINSSTFRKGVRANKGRSDKYSSAIVLMSMDDIKDSHSKIFKDPNKLQDLYRLGWTSIGIADDKEQEFTFCTGLEGGACTQIPYSYTYKSLQASDLYQDADQLSRFTSRVVGKFKRINFKRLTRESALVKLMVSKKVDTLLERFGGK